MQIMKLLDDHEAGTYHHHHCPDTWLPKYLFDSDSGLQQWVPGPDYDPNNNATVPWSDNDPDKDPDINTGISKSRQFVEMTLEYLQSSDAVLNFPTQKHTKSRDPSNASSTSYLYTEADFDDGGDEKDDYDDEAAA